MGSQKIIFAPGYAIRVWDGALIMVVPSSARDGELVEITQLKSVIVRNGFLYWDGLRHGRGFPARSDVSPREAAGLLRHIAILSVLDEQEDYLFRLVGDEVTTAYDAPLSRKRVSEMDAVLPGASAAVKELLDAVRGTATPVAYRNWLKINSTGETFNHREAVFMPLGKRVPVVDHILVVDAPMSAGQP